jgi:hypothetical protein
LRRVGEGDLSPLETSDKPADGPDRGKLGSVCVDGLISPTLETVRSRTEGWRDVERAATVKITSDEKGFPVESAFASEEAQGWRAAEAGPQTIRLVFDRPHSRFRRDRRGGGSREIDPESRGDGDVSEKTGWEDRSQQFWDSRRGRLARVPSSGPAK